MTIDKNCAITNDSGKEVVVLNAEASATNAVSGSTQMVYEQALTLMPGSDGSKVIKSGATQTVVLDGTYVDKTGKTQPSLIYELILADATTLAPVKNVAEMLCFGARPPKCSQADVYPPITATADDAKQMSQAIFFAQTIAAYPSSDLAKSFAKALTDAQQNAPTISQIDAAMQKFFQGTKGFTLVDFPSYMAATTYLSTFLKPWVPDGGSLYLYGVADAGDPTKPKEQQPNPGSNQGQITFTAGSGPLDPTDHNSGYTVQFTPASGGGATQLHFDKGQLVNQITDIPSIALQGTWALKSMFTHNDADSTLWAVFVGSVNGTQVLAVAQPPESEWSKFWSGLTFQKVMNLFLEGMGIWMALDFLKTKLASKEKKLQEDQANENNGADPSPQQQQEAKDQSDKVGQEAEANQQKVADRLGSEGGEPNVDVPDEANLGTAQDGFKTEQVDTLKQTSSDMVESSISEGQFQLDTTADFGVNPPIEQSAQNLQDATTNLNDGNLSEAKTKLSDARTNLNEGVKDLNITGEALESIENSQAAQTEYEQASDEVDSQGEDVADGDVPDIDPVEG